MARAAPRCLAVARPGSGCWWLGHLPRVPGSGCCMVAREDPPGAWQWLLVARAAPGAWQWLLVARAAPGCLAVVAGG